MTMEDRTAWFLNWYRDNERKYQEFAEYVKDKILN